MLAILSSREEKTLACIMFNNTAAVHTDMKVCGRNNSVHKAIKAEVGVRFECIGGVFVTTGQLNVCASSLYLR